MSIVSLAAFCHCTTATFALVPEPRQAGGVFVSAQGLSEPYESVGLVQVTRRGPVLFGWADPAGTDLQSAITEVEGQIRLARADGLINTRIEQTNLTPMARIFGVIFFFIPLPGEVTITGELVRIRRGFAPPPPPPLPPTGGTL
jgi:hypothetical protein